MLNQNAETGVQSIVPDLGQQDLLRVEDLSIDIRLQRGRISVLKNVNFRIPFGKTVALVGESGSGKTIAAKSILGILPKEAEITTGRILFKSEADTEVYDHAEQPTDGKYMQSMRGGQISMIFQEPMTSLSPLHIIGEQVEEALRLHQFITGKDAKETTVDMLRMVGFPDPARAYGMYPIELSGGLRQRAMIAMAAICHPSLLIADEPTTALDVTVQAQVLGLLRSLQERLQMSLLLITHDLGVVANMAEEIVVLYHGEVMEAGTATDIFRNSGHAYTRALMKAVPSLDMKPGEKLIGLREIDEVMPPMLAKQASERSTPTEPLLQVRGLTKSFKVRAKHWFASEPEPFVAVSDVSFDVQAGQCFGIVGESGCGKSTLSKLILQAIGCDSGEVIYSDGKTSRDVTKLSRKELFKFRREAQMVFQDPFGSLNPRSTIMNILCEPLEIHSACSRSQAREMAEQLVRMVGLQPTVLNRFPHSFSGGQRQRVGIARALALSPRLLVCDEPVSALDVSVQAQILNLLKKLQTDLNLTSIFVSHNLAVIKYMADRIAVMRRGRIYEIASAVELFKNPMHPYTKQLLDAVPHADLDHPLHFNEFNLNADEEEANQEVDWPAMYRTVDNPEELELRRISDTHYVLARDEIVVGKGKKR